jgi:hypothetical protein
VCHEIVGIVCHEILEILCPEILEIMCPEILEIMCPEILEFVCTVHFLHILLLLTKKCTLFDVNNFFSLLHSYMFRCISLVVIRESLCIPKLLSLLKRNDLLYTDVTVR